MSPTTASDGPEVVVDEDTGVDTSMEAQRKRAEQGPFEILVLPPDDNPALPPEVWLVPPPGVKLPE